MATDTGTTDSTVEQAANKLRAYRAWAGGHSRLGRVLLFVGTLFAMMLVGLAVPTLQATVGVAVTMVLSWAVFLVVLYTWYALGWSVVVGWRGGA